MIRSMEFRIIVLLLMLVFLTASIPSFASAATKAGIKPGSFWYAFDRTFERVSLFLTRDPEKKAQKVLVNANERLAEAEALAEEGKNTDAIKTTIADYEKDIALVTEKSKEVKDKGRVEGLLASIADSTAKHQETLAAVLSKVPDDAKEAISKAIEASRKGQEEATLQIAELKSEVEQLKKEIADLKSKEVKSPEQSSQNEEKDTQALNDVKLETQQAKQEAEKARVEAERLQREADVARLRAEQKLIQQQETQRAVEEERRQEKVRQETQKQAALREVEDKLSSLARTMNSYADDMAALQNQTLSETTRFNRECGSWISACTDDYLDMLNYLKTKYQASKNEWNKLDREYQQYDLLRLQLLGQ